jgi:hypothetical protein
MMKLVAVSRQDQLIAGVLINRKKNQAHGKEDSFKIQELNKHTR